jgi:CDP-diacylglycerol--glycerol-3-phosphate 3-phosphatidyltransferase
VASFAIRRGVTPNAVTVIGAVGVVITAPIFYTRGHYFWGSLIIAFFALSDLFDGAMARISQQGASAWGGFLDSTVDRITDSTIIISLLIPMIRKDDQLSYLALIALVTGLLIPYIRARAESYSIECSVGLAERTERLIIILVAAALHGLEVPYALAAGFWLLAILGFVTVAQRMFVVRIGLRNRQ